MLPDAGQPASPKRRQAVLVFESAELPFHGGAATVEALPLVRPVGDRSERDRATLAQADDRDDAAS